MVFGGFVVFGTDYATVNTLTCIHPGIRRQRLAVPRNGTARSKGECILNSDKWYKLYSRGSVSVRCNTACFPQYVKNTILPDCRLASPSSLPV